MKVFSKFLGDRRAITPVLSNLLLTIVAVAAMSIATTATYMITRNLQENMSERVIVEDLWFSNSTGMSIYLRNIGKIGIRVSAVYVNHTSQPFGSFSLEMGRHRWFNISCSWSSDTVYYVDIVTVRGTHIADYYKAP